MPWCHLWRVCVQCGRNMHKDPSPWHPNQSYVSRQSYKTPTHTIGPCLGMIWAPMTLNLPQWDKLTRCTFGWVGVQCERQRLNHPTPRPQTQSYTSHQSFGTPLEPIGHCLCRNLGQNQLKSAPRGLLCPHGATYGGFGSSAAPTYTRTHPHGLPTIHMYPGNHTKHQETAFDLVLV